MQLCDGLSSQCCWLCVVYKKNEMSRLCRIQKTISVIVHKFTCRVFLPFFGRMVGFEGRVGVMMLTVPVLLISQHFCSVSGPDAPLKAWYDSNGKSHLRQILADRRANLD